MNTLVAGLIFAAGWGAIVVWMVIFVLGMGFNDGSLTLRMNDLREGWFEVGFLGFLVIVYPFALRHFWLRH